MALEPANNCGLQKMFWGGFWRHWNEQIMGSDEQREEAMIGADEGGGVASAGTRGKRSGVDGLEFPVVARLGVNATRSKAVVCNYFVYFPSVRRSVWFT